MRRRCGAIHALPRAPLVQLGVPLVAGGLPSAFFDDRRRSHQTIAPTMTAPARMPNAIQPHCVLLLLDDCWLLAATAAPATAALPWVTPDVVVADVVVAEVVVAGGAVTVAVCVCVCVWVTVTVVGEDVVTVAVVAGAVWVGVGVDAVAVVGGVPVVAVRVTAVCVAMALVTPPPPHDERRSEASTPRTAAAAYLGRDPVMPRAPSP